MIRKNIENLFWGNLSCYSKLKGKDKQKERNEWFDMFKERHITTIKNTFNLGYEGDLTSVTHAR